MNKHIINLKFLSAIGALILICARVSAAQCDSQLGSALKPISENSSFSWSTEITSRYTTVDYSGFKKESRIFMLLLNGEYQLNEELRVLVEFGHKDWTRSGNAGDGVAFEIPGFGHIPFEDDNWRSRRHSGLREAFVENSNTDFQWRIGLQSMASRDRILLDERVLGGSIDWTIGSRFSLQAGAGTVDLDYSRLGKFCASRHSYRPLKDYYTDHVSDNLWETNLAYVDFFYEAERLSNGESEEEFGSFDSFDDFSDSNVSHTKYTMLSWQGVGSTLLRQFGDGFDTDSMYLMFYSTFKAFGHVDLNMAVGSDLSSDSSNMSSSLTADYTTIFESGSSVSIELGYWWSDQSSETTGFDPAFSNLFIGETAKLDLKHAPLVHAELEYTFSTAWPVFASIAYTAQSKGSNVRETDVSFGIRPSPNWTWADIGFGDHISIVSTIFQIKSDTLIESFDGCKVELRWAF